MKIQKINLKHIGTYSNFIWDDVIKFIEYEKIKNSDGSIVKQSKEKSYELDKLNLFYGENGSGKSTLSKLFRLINGELQFKNDLKPWGSASEISYIVYDDVGGNLNGKIKIFDKQYIKEQVGDFIFDSDESTDQNKSRGEHFLMIGDFVGREKDIQKKELEVATKERDNTLKTIAFSKQELEYKAFYGDDYEFNYNRIIKGELQEEHLESGLSEVQKELLLQEVISKDSRKIKELPESLEKLKRIEIIDQHYWDSFQKTIDSAISFMFGEKDQVKKMIELTNEHNLEKCLLCDQDIKYDGFYIERIQQLMTQIIAPQVDIVSASLFYLTNILDEIINIDVSQNKILAKNKVFYDHYQSIRIGNAKLYPDRISVLDKEDTNVIESCKKIISNKQNKLSEKIEVGELSVGINNIIIKINEAINYYNNQISLIEEDIIILQQKHVSEGDIERTKTHIKTLEKQKVLIQDQLKIGSFIKEGKDIAAELQEINTTKRSIDIEKSNIRDDFSTFTGRCGIIIKKLIELLNPGLARKVNFNLQGTYSYGRGRCGFEIKHSESATIITKYLSDGEKRSIAFSYFLSQFFELNDDGDLALSVNYGKDFIIVFDDPSTDYDKNNKSIIAEKIVELSKGFEQTFVLTHDEKFRDYVIKQTDINPIGGDLKRYKITKNYLGKSSISILNKDQSEINHGLLLFSLVDANPDLSCVAHALRYCVENLICNNLLGDSESSIDALVKNKLGGRGFDCIKKANDKNSEIRSLYTFCNNNGSHYGEADGFEALAEHIRSYFEIHDYIFGTTFCSSLGVVPASQSPTV